MVTPTASSSYLNRGITGNVSSFDKDSLKSGTKSPMHTGGKSSSSVGHHFPRKSVGVTLGSEPILQASRTGAVSPSSHVSRKEDQWNVKRDIPAGAVRNNPFAAKDSPRKKNAVHNSAVPNKMSVGSKGRLVTNTTSPRGLSPKAGSYLWEQKQNATTKSYSVNSVQNSKQLKSSNTQNNEKKEGTSTQSRRWEPTREIPNGTVKGRMSTLFGQSKPTGGKSTLVSKSTPLNTSTPHNDKSKNVGVLDVDGNGEDQWIIPERNKANTQVSANDWGEAVVSAKSAESDDWETPAKEWIRSGDSQTESSLSNRATRTLSQQKSNLATQKPSETDELIGDTPVADTGSARGCKSTESDDWVLPAEGWTSKSQTEPFSKATSNKKSTLQTNVVFEADKRNEDNNGRDFTPGKTKVTTMLPPPPKDANAYHHQTQLQPSTNVSSRGSKNDSVTSDSFAPQAFESVFKMDSVEEMKFGASFPTRDSNEVFQPSDADADAFGFPLSSVREPVGNKTIGEIIGGDEFFDASVSLGSDRPAIDNEKFGFHPSLASTTNSDRNEIEDNDDNNEFHSGKGEAKKKRKGFFKGLFGRKAKDKESSKFKESRIGEKKVQIRNEPHPSSTYFSDVSMSASGVNTQSSINGKAQASRSMNQNGRQPGTLPASTPPDYSIVRNNDVDTVGGKVQGFSDGKGNAFTVDGFSEADGGEKSETKTPVTSSSRSKLMHDDVFDDLEPDILPSPSNATKENGDKFFDPKLDHLDMEMNSEDESNSTTDTDLSKSHILDSSLLAQGKQRTSRHVSRSEEEAGPGKRRLKGVPKESRQDTDKAMLRNVVSQDKTSRKNSEIFFDEETSDSNRTTHDLSDINPVRSTMKKKSATQKVNIMASRTRIRGTNTGRITDTGLAGKDSQETQGVRSASPARSIFSNQARSHSRESKSPVQRKPSTVRELKVSNVLNQSRKYPGVEAKGRGTKARVSGTDESQVKDLSRNSVPPSRVHSSMHSQKLSMVRNNSNSGDTSLSGSRFRKKSVVHKLRNDQTSDLHRKIGIGRHNDTRFPGSIGYQNSNQVLARADPHSESIMVGGKNKMKFSKASKAYHTIAKKNSSEDPEDEKGYLTIHSASTGASDASCSSSTYENYQKRLAESLRKSNVVTRNKYEYISLQPRNSLDDTSIESDIRVLRTILRRPRLHYNNDVVIKASRQIEGFPTYDINSATDPMQRVGLRLLSSAIIPIQTEVRRFLAMRHALTRMWALIVVQTYARRFLAQKRYHRAQNSIITMQAAMRGHFARNDIIDKHICAIEIQRFVRGYLATMEVYEEIYKVTLVQSLVRMKIAMDHAAYRMSLIIQLQAIARGFLVRQQRAHLDKFATMIQSSWRCFYNRLTYQFDLLDIIIVQSLWRRTLAMRAAARKVEEKRSAAATAIQACWRAYDCRMDILCYLSARVIQSAVRMYLCRYDYVEYQAAKAIQSIGRMYLCRSDYVEYEAAKTIQSIGRMHLCRCEYVEYQAAKAIQSVGRMYLCRYDYVEYQAACEIQSALRMYLCRCDFLQYKAARAIQAAWRCHDYRVDYLFYISSRKIQSIGRMFVCRIKYNNYRAAMLIQSISRMVVARSKYVEYQASTRIQAVVRTFLCRAKYEEKLAYLASRVIQTKWRAFVCRKIYIENFAATMIQAKWRSYDCSSMYKRYCSARSIQKTWRSYDCQMNFLHFLTDILIVQSTIRRFLVQRKVKAMKNQAATSIQRMWRGFVCFADYEEFKAARKIQSTWRGFVCERNYRREKSAVVIQSAWRGFLIYADYMFELSDIVVVQKEIRGWLARRQASRKKAIAKTKRERIACTVIQTNWRRFWCFSNFMITLDCTIQIQAHVRGHIQNKKYSSQKQAALAIQSNWRNFFAKKLASQLAILHNITHSCSQVGERESGAATMIQRLFRGSLCRTALKVHLAAVLIQSRIRGNQARTAVRLYVAVRKIQAAWRAFTPRQSYVTYISARRIQATWRRYIPRQGFVTFVAAQRIQKKWRSIQAKQKVSLLRTEYLAASLIQSVWRGFVSYTDFVFTLSDIVVAQRIARGYLSRKKFASVIRSNLKRTIVQTKGAVAFQRIYRGFHARQNYWYTLGCTMQLQSWWRGRRIYNMMKKQANALLVLQCFMRCCLARQEYMQRRFVFVLIQTAELERSKKIKALKMKEQVREDMDEYQRDKAACVIQRFFLHVKHETDEFVLATKRRKKWRKEMKKERDSDDVEEAFLEDVWIGLVAQSSLNNEPFTRHYANFGSDEISVATSKSRKYRIDDYDQLEFTKATGVAVSFTSHPTSSIRVIPKVDPNVVNEDFQLEEAFIDAEIRNAKKKMLFSGNSRGRKGHSISCSNLDTRSRKKSRSRS